MNKTINLDPSLGFPATASITITAETAADVFQAITQGTAFPSREINLGTIAANFSGGNDVALKTAAGDLTFKADASVKFALGIYDKPESVLAALAIKDASDLKLDFSGDPTRRYAVLVAGYTVDVSGSGVHPIGVVGKATFGVDTDRAATFAVVTRFAAGDAADQVIDKLLGQWRLPSRIGNVTDLDSGTVVLIEVDGSIAFKLGAQLGYDVSYVQAVAAGGLTGDLGLKIAAALSTQIKFEASGRFLLCVDHPDAINALRLRMFKLRKKDLSFALDLTVGVTPVTPTLPANVDDLVATIFGVQGKQVIADLKKIDQWTSPTTSIGNLVAGLVNNEALALLTKATGIDAQTAFNAAKAKFLDGLKAWDALPGQASAWLWQELQGAGLTPQFQILLNALAASDDTQAKAMLDDQLKKVGFDQTQFGQLMESLTDTGVLALLDDLPKVRAAAKSVQTLLAGGFLKTLQDKILTALNLDQVLKAAQNANWTTVDGWLVARLSAFFGDQLQNNQFEEVRKTIGTVLAARKKLYDSLRAALTRTYEAKFALAYERATTSTALLDATFDWNEAKAVAAFSDVARNSNWDALFVQPTPGVTIASGILTHGITRNTSLQFTLPMLNAKFTDVTTSLAQLSVESDGQTLVGTYSLTASDDFRSVDRYRSRLTLGASFAAEGRPNNFLRIHGEPQSTWNYSFRYVQANASVADIRSLLDPIQRGYFSDLFSAAGGSFDTWLADLDRAAEDQLHNGTNSFGDVMVALELATPGLQLQTWFQSRSSAARMSAACAASKAIQRVLRDVILKSYTSDLAQVFGNEPMFSLLVYASLPPRNHLEMDEDGNVTETTEDPYFDFPHAALVDALADSLETGARIAQNIEPIRQRLEAAGRKNDASFFAATNVPQILKAVVSEVHYTGNLSSLLFVESEIIRGATQAIFDAADFAADASQTPASALTAMAAFGEQITRTFNTKLKSIYLPGSIKTIGSILFSEVTQAIGAATVADQQALLALTVLSKETKFKLTDFLDDKNATEPADVAVEQRLIDAG